MRQLFSFVFLMVLCVASCSAQQLVHRQRPGVSIPKHLSYEGIEIDGTSETFFDKLKRKGYKIEEKVDGYHYYTCAVGSFAEERGWEIVADCDDTDSIYSVMLYMSCVTGSSLLMTYDNVKKYIEKKYSIIGTERHISEIPIIDNEDTEIVYTVGILGNITVSYNIDDAGSYVCVRFTDRINSGLHGITFKTERYEISNISDVYKKCFIEISEDEGKFTVIDNNGNYRFISRRDDAEKLYYLLISKYDNTMKLCLINDYVIKQFNKCKANKNLIPIVTKEFETLLQNYLAKVQEKKRKDAELISNPRQLLLEVIRQTIFSKDERKMFDSLFSPEFQRQLIGGTIKVMASDAPTQWDLYSDSQKAIIHEYHNAK